MSEVYNLASESPYEQFLEEGRRFWQTQYGCEQGREDLRQIVENTTGFFDLLRRWDRLAGETERALSGDAPASGTRRPDTGASRLDVTEPGELSWPRPGEPFPEGDQP